MRQTFPGSVRSVGNREFKFTAVTAKLGCDGHILEPSGVDLSEYRKVPIVLWQHIATSPVARGAAALRWSTARYAALPNLLRPAPARRSTRPLAA
jgi:hypothetical protein